MVYDDMRCFCHAAQLPQARAIADNLAMTIRNELEEKAAKWDT